MGDPPPSGFGFRGRIGRTEYWTRMLLVLLGVALLRLVGIAIAFLDTGSPRYATTVFHDLIGVLTMLGHLLLSLVMCGLIFAIVVGLASTVVRRLHDRGRSGWWLVVFCVAGHRLLTDTSLWLATPMIVVPLAAGALLLWGAIELGVLPGQPADRSVAPA